MEENNENDLRIKSEIRKSKGFWKQPQYVKYGLFLYLMGIILMSVILMYLRIYFSINYIEWFTELRDVDYKTHYDLMDNGLFEYYQHPSYYDFKALYLYFWYFIFFPFYLLPLEIGVWIWDGLRLASSIYIGINFYKVMMERDYPVKTIEKLEMCADLAIFVIFAGVGYFSDMYLNNTNWLIQLLLFLSYKELNKGKKVRSGLLFVIATYKIHVIVFPILLLILKKIKWKDLLYYFIPFALICIPYMIYPSYFWQMYDNWVYVETSTSLEMNFFLELYILTWQMFQPGQMVYIGMLLGWSFQCYTTKNYKEKYIKFRWPLRILTMAGLATINISFPAFLWLFFGVG